MSTNLLFSLVDFSPVFVIHDYHNFTLLFALLKAECFTVVIVDDNLIVFLPKADDNSCVFVYSIHEHWKTRPECGTPFIPTPARYHIRCTNTSFQVCHSSYCKVPALLIIRDPYLLVPQYRQIQAPGEHTLARRTSAALVVARVRLIICIRIFLSSSLCKFYLELPRSVDFNYPDGPIVTLLSNSHTSPCATTETSWPPRAVGDISTAIDEVEEPESMAVGKHARRQSKTVRKRERRQEERRPSKKAPTVVKSDETLTGTFKTRMAYEKRRCLWIKTSLTTELQVSCMQHNKRFWNLCEVRLTDTTPRSSHCNCPAHVCKLCRVEQIFADIENHDPTIGKCSFCQVQMASLPPPSPSQLVWPVASFAQTGYTGLG